MIVIKLVEMATPLAAKAYDAEVPEAAKMLRNGRLREFEKVRYLADAPLTLFDGVDDAKARGIAQSTKDLRESVDIPKRRRGGCRSVAKPSVLWRLRVHEVTSRDTRAGIHAEHAALSQSSHSFST